mgnify:FL=1
MVERKFRLELEEILESIDLDDPDFPRKLREAEESEISIFYRDWSDFYFEKYKEIKKSKKDIDKKIPRFFLLRSLQLGYKFLNSNRDIDFSTPGTFFSKTAKKWISLGEDDSLLTETREHCFKNAFSFSMKALTHMKPLEKKRCSGYVGGTLSNLYRSRKYKKDNFGLECLVTAIASSELGNDTAGNYQVIAREYYDLQDLIEKVNRSEIKGMTIEKIKKITKNVINWKYRGKLGKIIQPFKDNLKLCSISKPNQNNSYYRGMEMQFIALQNALEAFDKSYDNGKGDTNLDNMSYRGMCITDIARLNNWLKKYSGAEIRKKLEGAEELLTSVLVKRLDEVRESVIYKRRLKEAAKKLSENYQRTEEEFNKKNPYFQDFLSGLRKQKGPFGEVEKSKLPTNKPPRKEPDLERQLLDYEIEIKIKSELYKDYRRLAECQFHLAELTNDFKERRRLFVQSIRSNLHAKNLLKGKTNKEIYSFIGESYYKLAKLSLTPKDASKRKKYLTKTADYLELAYNRDDKSPENRSKTGDCYIRTLEIRIKENDASEEEIRDLVKKTKETLEEAVKISEKKEREFYYPYCLLAEMSDILVDNKLAEIDNDLGELTKRYNWLTVVKKLFENKKYLSGVLKPIENKENVFVVNDEYGLMAHDLIIKKSEKREELANQFLWDKFIYDGMRDRGISSDSVPSSRPICLKEESSDEFYYVMRRSKGVNLDKKFYNSDDEGSVENEIRPALENFAKLHRRLISNYNWKNG